MTKNLLLLSFFALILRGITIAQNPYESLGKVAPILTLSEGKYQEFMTNDTIVEIGSVLFNTITSEVVAFLQEDTLHRMDADMTTRFLSVDPIGRKFPELTPYQFASNRPIDGVDLDGLEYSQSTDADGTIRYTVQLKIVDNSSLFAQVFKGDQAKYDAHIQEYIKELKKNESHKTEGQNYVIDIVPTLVTNKEEIEEIKKMQKLANEAMANKNVKEAQNAIQTYALILEDRINMVTAIEGNAGNTLLMGGTQGGTGKNIFTVAVINHTAGINSNTDKNGDIITETFHNFTMLSILFTINTTIHEVLHGGGLRHPWSALLSKISDSHQENPKVELETIKNNRMNSGANPIKELRNNNGTGLTKGQLEKIGESIKNDKKR